MDSSEATKIVFSRIQTLDPENATKIMGYIFIQDNGEKEMIRLAFGPETVLLSLIHKAKTQLGILSNSSSASSTPSSPSIFNPNRPNPFPLSSPRIIVPDNGFSGFSEYRSPSGHLCPKPASSPSYAAVVNGSRDSVSGPFSPPSRSPFSLPPHFCSNSNSSGLSNELLFLDESLNNVDYVDPIMSPTGQSDSMLFPYGMESGDFGGKHNFHRRSCSVSDVLLGGGSGGTEDGGNGFGWRPCVYFSRGFCKNGNSCKFLHGGFPGSPESKLDGFDELLRMKAIQQQRFAAAAAAAASQLMGGGAFPYNKNMNILNDSPRSPSAALMMGEEFHNFGRCRPERSDFSVLGLEESGNSSSRQIYLTFPADSSFMEEDVSNYFSTFGPVQDVRIPYQQKRMFGFVSFVYPETVKIILAKGNPHFVCDSRVLVKPYKEKGKVLDKKQQQHHMERGLSFDSLDPYDLPVGPRMFLNSQEMMLRRRLEQVELRQAIEFQGRRMMNLQVTDLDNHHHSDQFQPNQAPGIPVPSHAQPHLHINQSHLLRSDGVNQEVFEENNSSSRHSPTADQQLEMKEVCNNSNDKDSANINEQCSYPEYDDIHESLEHILPDNLFASPTKSAGDHRSIFSTDSVHADDSTSVTTTSSSDNSPTLPATSTLNMASPKSCFFQILRKVE